MIDEISRPELVNSTDLKTLKNWALVWCLKEAPRFSEWLVGWIGDEEVFRAKGTERTHEHLLSRPADLAEWSDGDLARALGACTSLHFSGNQTDSVGRLADRWYVLASHAASNRLLEHAANA